MHLRFRRIKISIIDYGMGNLQSVKNALSRFGLRAEITNDISVISKSDAFILPGVGAFGKAMSNLRSLKLIDPIKDQILSSKKPIMGICLGMQLLADNSEEKGNHQGLGLIEGTVKKINTQKKYRLPHIGWNDIKIVNKKPIFPKILKEDAFYFVHSFEFKAHEKYISSFTDYGNDIVASVQNENIFGVQFHPEKSKTSGLLIFRNFLKFVEKRL